MTTGPNRPLSSAIRTESRRAVRIRRRIAQIVGLIGLIVAFVGLIWGSTGAINDNPGVSYMIYIGGAVFIVAFPFVGWNSFGPHPTERPDGGELTWGTRQVVDEFLARLSAGDATRVADLFAPQVDWALNWPDGPATDAVPWVRHRPDRAAVEQHFRDLAHGNRPVGRPAAIEGILVDGQHAVVLGTLRNTVVATGRAYEARFALHLVVSDGAITGYHVYEDSLSVALAAGAVTTT